jgi:3-oxoacyl-[acyl-carrier-protein] synthase II
MVNGQKVVITGCGVLTTIGDTLEKYWLNLCQGNNGYGPLSRMETSGYKTKIGGEIKNFRPEQYIPDFQKKKDYLGKTSQLAISASYLALKDANISLEKLAGLNVGTIIGTTDGEPESIEKMDVKLAGRCKEFDKVAVSLMSPYRIAYSVARELNLTGPVCTVASACAAGNHAIGLAWEQIVTGSADMMIVGGADSFSRKTFTGFNRLGATAVDYCRPFDENRTGMIPSEGAGVIVLESLEHARKRNASIYAEVLGCGASCDAFHMTLLNEEGIALAMENALQNAGIKPEEIDLICAHGTGTLANDPAESKVINQIYGSQVPVTANKSVLGHTMGAASMLNVITIALVMQKNVIPKISNVNKIDPSCQINCVLENIYNTTVNYGQSNGFAFGGNNGVVILKNGKLLKGV